MQTLPPAKISLPQQIPDSLALHARIDVKAVCATLGCSRAWLYGEIAAGRFLKPFKQGPRYSRWAVADVLAYLERSPSA